MQFSWRLGAAGGRCRLEPDETPPCRHLDSSHSRRCGILASASLWVRPSYFKEDFLVGQETRSLIELGADRGTAVAYRFCYRNNAPNNRKWSHVTEQGGKDPIEPENTPWRGRFGFGVATVFDQSRARYFMCPFLAVTLYFLVASALLFPMSARLRRSRRRKSGCCEKCGYDLRGSPVRCPEAGQSWQSDPAPPLAGPNWGASSPPCWS